jgi:hypothetical protein
MMNRLLFIPMALALSGLTALRAQDTPRSPLAALTTDSTAWQRILAHVIGTLSTQLLDAATDPTPQPWRLELPDDPERQQLLTQLRTLFRARQVMPADTLFRSLEVGALVISNDTARVDVRFEETRKCPAASRTTGFGWSATVVVPRDPTQKFWGAASSPTMRGGDRLPC